ncbi:autotransporter outer membrane beta-barrel domain-containing protein, partial [Brucella intermedia]|uniref:autotransporter outer membrane beta-barrel domain-containing protein n=1 Tax=Brucella intermedia TaxID=94625 RepID=UPI00235E18F4
MKTNTGNGNTGADMGAMKRTGQACDVKIGARAASSRAAVGRRRLSRAAALLAASSVLAISAVLPTAALAADLHGVVGTTVDGIQTPHPDGLLTQGGYGNGWGGSGPSNGKGGDGDNTNEFVLGGAGGSVGATTVTQGLATISGQNGADGAVGLSNGRAWGRGAGGGGGGAGLYLDHQTARTYSGLTITGGAGGKGGKGQASAVALGGPGGGGGAGVVVNGGSFTNVAGATIVGGAGGGGGTATGGTQNNYQGPAGGGGDAVVVQEGATFINEGTVTGGNGANVGNGGPLSNSGAGIRVGDNGYVVNAGSVSAGAPSGTAPSNAIEIVGNNATLELRAGSSIAGMAKAATGTTNSTLALGGTTDSTLDASEIGSKYVGFQHYLKTGDGKWSLTGATTEVTPWNINQGTLSVETDASLGDKTGKTTVDGGTLEFAGTTTSERNVTLGAKGGAISTTGGTTATLNGVVEGPGGLTKTGTGTLELTKKGTYTGSTTVDDGILKLVGDGDISSSSGINIGGKGTIDFTGVNTSDVDIKGVTGDGKLERGDKNLHITDGNGSTYTGDFGGSGKVYIDGGKQGLGGNQTYTGDTIVTAGSELALVNGNLVNSSVTVDGILSGSGSMKNLINNAGGNIDPGTADSFGTLTVTGDYTGNGGTLTLHEKLEGDATEGDRFVVNGNTSGKTGVVLINRGGNGAATTQGVQVITVGGKSEGTFDLAKGDQQTTDGRWAVIAGAYAYTLDPNGKGFALNSQLASDLNRPNPNPNPGPNPGPNRYAAGVPLYSGASQMLGVVNRSALTTLSERTGNRYWTGAGARQIAQGDGPGSGAEAAPAPDAAGSLVDAGVMWGRIDAAHGRYDL